MFDVNKVYIYYASGDVEQIFVDELIKTVRKKKNDFFVKYWVYPKFIKVPEGFISAFEIITMKVIKLTTGEKITFMGLQICETPSVQTIDKIEVF